MEYLQQIVKESEQIPAVSSSSDREGQLGVNEDHHSRSLGSVRDLRRYVGAIDEIAGQEAMGGLLTPERITILGLAVVILASSQVSGWG
jgi:hypothetical protein